MPPRLRDSVHDPLIDFSTSKATAMKFIKPSPHPLELTIHVIAILIGLVFACIGGGIVLMAFSAGPNGDGRPGHEVVLALILGAGFLAPGLLATGVSGKLCFRRLQEESLSANGRGLIIVRGRHETYLPYQDITDVRFERRGENSWCYLVVVHQAGTEEIDVEAFKMSTQDQEQFLRLTHQLRRGTNTGVSKARVPGNGNPPKLPEPPDQDWHPVDGIRQLPGDARDLLCHPLISGGWQSRFHSKLERTEAFYGELRDVGRKNGDMLPAEGAKCSWCGATESSSPTCSTCGRQIWRPAQPPAVPSRTDREIPRSVRRYIFRSRPQTVIPGLVLLGFAILVMLGSEEPAYPIVYITGGLGILLFTGAIQEPRDTLGALKTGICVPGTIDRVIQRGQQHESKCFEVRVRFELDGEWVQTTYNTKNPNARHYATGDSVSVLYLADKPRVTTLWPPVR